MSTKFACVYHNLPSFWPEWNTICKQYKLRSYALSKPSDLPYVFKNHGMGMLQPGLFCLCSNDGDTKWSEIIRNSRNFTFQVLFYASNNEIEYMDEWFDARIKRIIGRNGQTFVRKVSTAPPKPSDVAESLAWFESDEHKRMMEAAHQFEDRVVRPIKKQAMEVLFERLNNRQIQTIETILDLAINYEHMLQIKDYDNCERIRCMIMQQAEKYIDFCITEIRRIGTIHLNKREEEEDKWAETHPDYRKFYYKPQERRFIKLDDYIKFSFREDYLKFTKERDVQHIFTGPFDFLKQIGLEQFTKKTVVPGTFSQQQRLMKPIIVQQYKPKY